MRKRVMDFLHFLFPQWFFHFVNPFLPSKGSLFFDRFQIWLRKNTRQTQGRFTTKNIGSEIETKNHIRYTKQTEIISLSEWTPNPMTRSWWWWPDIHFRVLL
jgi:hypothetical protein